MAKKRNLNIDSLLFDTELVECLTTKGLLLYELLWGHADDWGGVELNIKDLALRTGALRMTTDEVTQEIEKLINGLKKVIPYSIENKQYGWIRNFFKHQALNNPAMPTIPLPEWITYKIHTYPSGKKWADYKVIQEKLPVAYQYTTSKSETKPIETIPIETKSLKDQPSAALKDILDKVSIYINIYSLINRLKKEYKAKKAIELYIPDEVLIKVCNTFLRTKEGVKDPWPWFYKTIQEAWRDHNASEAQKANTGKRDGYAPAIKEILGLKP